MLPLFLLLITQLLVSPHCSGSFVCLFGCPENVRIFVFLLNLSRCQYILGKLHNNFLLAPKCRRIYLSGESASASLQNLSKVRSTEH